MRFELHRDLIDDIAKNHGVSPDLVMQLLALEPDFVNLGEPNAKNELKRVLTDAMDAVLRADGDASAP